MTTDFFSIRVNDKRLCSNIYAESRKGKTVGNVLHVYSCIPKKDVKKVGKPVSNDEWRKYGILQRYLVPKNNVEPCIKNGKESLCPINENGEKDITSIEKRHGMIVKLVGMDADENSYTVISGNPYT